MTDLVAHRQALSNIIGKGGPDSVAAYQARAKLDQFLDNLGQGNTQVSGYGPPSMAPDAVGPTLQTARGNTRSAMSASEISGELSPASTGFVERAEARAGTPGRQSVDTQLRNRAGAILESNKDIRGFLPDEVEALKAVRDGTATRNTLAWFGQRFGNLDWRSMLASGGMGGLVGGVFGHGTPGMSALALGMQSGGVLAKAVANAMAKGQTRVAEELVRSNSPLARGLSETAPLSYSPGAGRDATIMRLLGPGLLDEPLPQSRLPPGYI
jgi:hypothetical protein